jgi:hypothetical protein
MNKGSQAPATMLKPTQGKDSGSKVTGGKTMQPFAGTAKPGKKVKK